MRAGGWIRRTTALALVAVVVASCARITHRAAPPTTHRRRPARAGCGAAPAWLMRYTRNEIAVARAVPQWIRYAEVTGRQQGQLIGEPGGSSHVRLILVVMHARRFVLTDARVPPGAKLPSGPYVFMTLDPVTHEFGGEGVQQEPIDLRSAGVPVRCISVPKVMALRSPYTSGR